ncbi:MAG: winged helix-turn-helix domain-containing protein [Chloroflexi bacterium]|nr:winged helix-turn-helix domain-containing protein [Chloroflexota bacterium]
MTVLPGLQGAQTCNQHEDEGSPAQENLLLGHFRPRDVLNRALHNLAKENLIQVERHLIQILDYQGLEAKPELNK